MVKNPRETPGADPIRPINNPIPATVQEDKHHKPVALTINRQRQRITAIEDQWEIEEEWWRTDPVSRLYYRVTLEDGTATTIFRDQETNKWYQQRY